MIKYDVSTPAVLRANMDTTGRIVIPHEIRSYLGVNRPCIIEYIVIKDGVLLRKSNKINEKE